MNKRPYFLIFVLHLAIAFATVACAGEYHVAATGKDSNPGSRSQPLRTISAAAELAQPGDVITVHEGVYRERIAPPRGGLSDTQRIVYRAAPGEKVEIKGSEVVKDWVKVRDDVWKVTLPNKFFGHFNPYNDLIHGDWFGSCGRPHHTGAVYINGDWLTEAPKLEEVMMPSGTSPTWLAQNGGACLLNVAWLRLGGGSGDAGRIPATGFAARHNTQNAPFSEGGNCVGWIRHGDWLRYDGIKTKRPIGQIQIRAASEAEGGIIEIRQGAPDGELLGTCSVPNTGGWQSWATFDVKIKPLAGPAPLFLVFKQRVLSALNPRLWFAQVDMDTTTIWAQFPDVNPNEQLVEINVRQTVFYPKKPGMNYITVSGFTMRHAAPPWAPPTAEQMGLIGTHWSKGWIIENNTISHCVCSGIALGKYGDEWDNRAESAEGYVGTIHRAHAFSIPWTKQTIGGHLVRNNHISFCEQTGVVGSLGCSFSTVTGNTIHDIHVRRLFSGAEMAGIKFHGAIDVEISHNHIYRTCLGVWLDWMAQGTRVTRNLFHDNDRDLFVEVDHGPFVVDNNLFLSPATLLSVSQGGAYVHNLIAGHIDSHQFDGRLTPFHKAHSTELAGLHNNPCGDNRVYNNLCVRAANLNAFDNVTWPMWLDGNVFFQGAKACKHEKDPVAKPDYDPAIKLVERADGWYLDLTLDKDWTGQRKRSLVTTELLGKAKVANLPYEHRDGSPLRVNVDYFGKPRDESIPTPGPFENPGQGELKIKVW